MRDIVVVGAGRIGETIADMLASTAEYAVTIVDKSLEQLGRLDTGPGVTTKRIDIAEPGGLESVLSGKFAVLSAAPYALTTRIAEAAAAAGVHYLDLTEDVKATRAVKALAAKAQTAFIPQCGLAPGFISIVANSLAATFDTLEDVRMRVGALPQFPSNVLNYNLTWSPEGVINEYCEPCEAIVDGEAREIAPLEDREEFALDGIGYEAFNTSGGLGSLCHSMAGRVKNLSYKTIRYPGHAAIMKLLLNDLKLSGRQDLVKQIFEHALGPTEEDVVVIYVTITGTRNGRPAEAVYSNAVFAGHVGHRQRSAIQRVTAAGVSTVLDLLAHGQLPQKGFVQQDAIPLEVFLANRFGRLYAETDKARAQQVA